MNSLFGGIFVKILIFTLFTSGRAATFTDGGPIDNNSTRYAESRVVNGLPAGPTDFPNHVFITVYGGLLGLEIINYCSGSIIGSGPLSRWVLTAGTCIVTDILQLGSYLLEAGINEEGVAEQTVGAFWFNSFRHPGYTDLATNNIGLIKTNTPFVTSNYVKPIQVAPISWSGPAVMSGIKGTGAGFGYVTNTGPSSNTLLKAELTVIPQTDCSNRYEYSFPNSVYCAESTATPRQALCRFDVGTALVVVSRGVRVQSGIFIFFSEDGCTTDPNGFTNVGNYNDWIKLIMDRNP
ncbi:hypothetical protein DMENIID0001_022180 [Sergentomyia squamirostris]